MKTTQKIARASMAIRLSVAALLMIAGLCITDLQAADKNPAFKKASEDLITKVRAMIGKDRNGAIKAYAKGARLLAKDYPNEIGPRAMLLNASSLMEDAKEKKAILTELVALKDAKFAPIVNRAKGQLKKIEALGKPVAIKFKALDGREVDLVKMKGKVVLIDFWATWCGPCIAVLPDLKRTYNKMHARGFEIIGISLENRKGPKELLAYVKKNGMPWPQYHDGQHWSNKIALSYGVQGIPTMFLIDKKGNLVDFDATIGLEAKVQKFLAK